MQNLSNNLLLQIKISKLQLCTRSENMAAKVTPTKCYQRDIGNVCSLCGSESVRLQLKIFIKTGEKSKWQRKSSKQPVYALKAISVCRKLYVANANEQSKALYNFKKRLLKSNMFSTLIVLLRGLLICRHRKKN